MKKVLLAGCLAVAGIFSVSAENRLYESQELGEVTGVSPNGQYVTISDYDNQLSYIWDASNPTVFTDITAKEGNRETDPSSMVVVGSKAMGVTDNGMVVGCLEYFDGHEIPAIWENGEWKKLPIHPATMNTVTAVAVTGDGKVIGGHAFIADKTSEIAGRYYPCRWLLQEDGSYEIKCYIDVDLPDHQGFTPMAQSPDGTVLAGQVWCGMGSTVPAILKGDEFITFAKLETRRLPWMFRGEYQAIDPETGEEYWTPDVNDPNLVLYDEAFIDGYRDGSMGFLSGAIQGVDNNGNCYGFRTVLSNVSEDGNKATFTSGACIYNYNEDTWIDNTSYSLFTHGFNGNYIFTRGDNYIKDGQRSKISEDFDVEFSQEVCGVLRSDKDGKVLAGMTQWLNPAIGEYQYFPFVLVLEKALAPNSAVELVEDAASDAKILLSAGRIDVLNASKVAIYDLNGSLISTDATSYVAPGIYVVMADKTQKKVVVK